VRDATNIADILTERYGFDSEPQVRLFNASATYAGVFQALEHLRDRVGAEDNVVVYFAGRRPYRGRGRRLSWQQQPLCAAALRYLDKEAPGAFAVSDLIQYVKRTVPNNANQLPHAGVLFKTGDLDGEMVLM